MNVQSQVVENVLLQQYIDPTNGRVNYEKLKNDDWLQSRINEWESMDLSQYSHEEQFVFWLNAYNLFTLKGVLMELEKNPNWQGNISWLSKIRFFYFYLVPEYGYIGDTFYQSVYSRSQKSISDNCYIHRRSSPFWSFF